VTILNVSVGITIVKNGEKIGERKWLWTNKCLDIRWTSDSSQEKRSVRT